MKFVKHPHTKHNIIEMEHEMTDLKTKLFEMHAEETAHMVDDYIEEDELDEAAVNACMQAFRNQNYCCWVSIYI